MKKINCPKCGKELINLSHDNTNEFWCCGMEIEINDGPEITINNDKLGVYLNNLNEGVCGDYNPEDPDDVNLLRFSVYGCVDDFWIEVEDASCCTGIPADSNIDELVGFAYAIFKEFSNVDLTSREEVSIATTKMSWLGLHEPGNCDSCALRDEPSTLDIAEEIMEEDWFHGTQEQREKIKEISDDPIFSIDDVIMAIWICSAASYEKIAQMFE